MDEDTNPSPSEIHEFVCNLLTKPIKQSELTDDLYKRLYNFMLAHDYPHWPKEDRIRLQSLYQTNASSWLFALPKIGETKMDNETFRTALLTYLGCDYPFVPIGLYCDCKRRSPIDTKGLHFHSCPKGDERISKHDAMKKLTCALISNAGIKYTLEPKHCFPLQTGKYRNRRPDILLHQPNLPDSLDGSKPILLDIAITHPCRVTILDKNTVEPLVAADTAYKDKVKSYENIQDNKSKEKYEFIPIIFESFGAFHPESKLLITKLIKKASINMGIPFSILNHYWMKRFAVTLQIGQASMMLHRSIRTIQNSCSIQDITCKADWLPY